jgi:hypothetical protein
MFLRKNIFVNKSPRLSVRADVFLSRKKFRREPKLARLPHGILCARRQFCFREQTSVQAEPCPLGRVGEDTQEIELFARANNLLRQRSTDG